MAQEIPFSAAATETLLAAGARPRSEGRLVVPEHLVWAVLANPSTPAAALLAEAGVTRDAIEAFLDRP
jgi:ClpA/ClpB-like protein